MAILVTAPDKYYRIPDLIAEKLQGNLQGYMYSLHKILEFYTHADSYILIEKSLYLIQK